MAKLNHPSLDTYSQYLHHHPHQVIIGYENQVLLGKIQTASTQLNQSLADLSLPYPPRILIIEPEPIQFISLFLAASTTNSHIFLCNPHWGQNEWEQVFHLTQPDLIIGSYPPISTPIPLPLHPPHFQTSSQIMIPTGGTSGQIKFAVHTWETLSASVSGFLQHFQLSSANFICTLPLYHVSGLMQFLRTFLSGGKLVITDYKQIESAILPTIHPQDFFISLVPTQLRRLLQHPPLIPWLSQMQAILLGGASPGIDLLNLARFHHLPLALTYGMTETASQIATLLPQEFLQGANHCGQVLPHAQIQIIDENGNPLPNQSIGQIQIQSASLMAGYYNRDQINHNFQNNFQPDDLGFFDSEKNLHIIGRNSDKIITGGENVFPAEIEAIIRSTGLVADIKIISIPDPEWGEAVTAIYVPHPHDYLQQNTIDKIKSQLQIQLSKYKIPKHWIPVSTIPCNPQGKVNRHELEKITCAYLT